VQLLAARGATVLATALPDDTGRLTKLGSAAVINYTAGSVVDQVLARYPNGVDALIDVVAHTADGLALTGVHPGGRVASSMGAANDEALTRAGLTGANINANPVRQVLAALAQQVAAGTLQVDVSTVLPLDQATEGLATIAVGKARGKIVIKIND
jgi:NADPH:quinone reductase